MESQKSTSRYAAALKETKGYLPAGEECKGALAAVQAGGALSQALHRCMPTLFSGLPIKKPRRYLVVYSAETVIFTGLSKTGAGAPYQPECFIAKPMQELTIKERHGRVWLGLYTPGEKRWVQVLVSGRPAAQLAFLRAAVQKSRAALAGS
ncbi:MAG: hypothetical protein ACK5L3_15245 [Oscillospiraceae bacterium]